ncbi:hypothetical protein CONPUDRAFT_101576 [Coniophora puteana RWD-64-598 SS2]|uniref:Pali-domain-containing protein n=1 Tax=Coniophora puteana (strain RWD-64-598) TaxID=741705 RepID=A0A5M3MWC7_CONPW|nr:uncharacterized protein CONPUDRAFT_101576 [Coniophora puteana RWD-64-598 SS2]EIW83044.1 hypothetical protein CONPUDRAFT_101576 [Coniophora puteana RWD-64-598 SS2]
MRKTSYAITFVATLATLILNILSARLPDWLIAKYEFGNAQYTVRYGLTERCERKFVSLPGPDGGSIYYEDYSCRGFPLSVQDSCDGENRRFCAAWSSAQYFSEFGIGLAALSIVALLIGVSTHSRRRRIWRAVAGLVLLHAIFQVVVFGIVTDLYRKERFPAFEHAKPGSGFILNFVSWIVGLLVGFGVIITGIAADKGKRWAAGNRYRPIGDA